ncbi:MAG TPA: xanthine dehydrogenase family protein molybdopterin-binding subunit [Bryobacteraceae bacterium]|nr:xanthine dehydrogenase family protein molybdopterin-binding subunit [Bryobacteraceae bacterium]
MITIGDPLARVDGPAKVTGEAKFSAEYSIPGLVYASLVMSTIPSGHVQFRTAAAERAPGVVAVLTPANAMRLPAPEKRLTLLQDDRVYYQNQPIALVVAETLEQAHYAASLVEPRYEAAPAKLDFLAEFPQSYPGQHNGEPGDQSWGDVEGGLRSAAVRVEQTYTTPVEHHNPMEPHATVAHWEGDHLRIYDATQHITGVQEDAAKLFAIPKENVHVTCLFTGGGFGCKGQVWSHVMLAALAAKQVKRPVKLALERPQMFGPVGARPRTHQQVTLGATREGKLTAIRHVVHTNTSLLEDYMESAAFPTRVMYACPNISTTSRLVQLNFGTPTYMRAPGVATGTYAIEVAMDELAYELKMDPLQLRLANYAETDPHSGEPFTGKHLRECYAKGAAQFGWSKRNHEPRSMRAGHELIGWGMATETYPGKNLPASALVRFQPDGRVLVASGTQEIGTGNYTVMTEVAASILRVPVSQIDARLGDSNLPEAPISAGSMSTASITPAVKAACEQARQKLIALAAGDSRSPLHGAPADRIELQDGKLVWTGETSKSEPFSTLLQRNGNRPVEAMASTKPQLDPKTPCHSFGAIFAEVRVDADLGTTRVKRVVAVYDVGRIINQRTARSQFIGGIVWGISLALLEDTHVDWRYGRIVNHDLEKYHLPVNADIPDLQVSALDIPDYKLDTLGARGVGEIGITGTGAAIANAVFHATGKRIRDVPITPDKLL